MKKGPSITKTKKEHKEAFLLNDKFLNKLYVKGYASCFATLDNRIQKFSWQVESILLDEQIICPTFWEHPSPRDKSERTPSIGIQDSRNLLSKKEKYSVACRVHFMWTEFFLIGNNNLRKMWTEFFLLE